MPQDIAEAGPTATEAGNQFHLDEDGGVSFPVVSDE